MPISDIENNLRQAFQGNDKEGFWSWAEQLMQALIYDFYDSSEHIYFDGIIPEIENWTKTSVFGSGYIWCFANKGNHQVVHPFLVELKIDQEADVRGRVNVGENGIAGADWNSRQKTKWDGLLYPDRFKNLPWAISFCRAQSGWRDSDQGG